MNTRKRYFAVSVTGFVVTMAGCQSSLTVASSFTPTASELSDSGAQIVGKNVNQPFPNDEQQIPELCNSQNCDRYGPRAIIFALPTLSSLTTVEQFRTEQKVALLKYYDNGAHAALGLSAVKKKDELEVSLQVAEDLTTWTAKLTKGGSSPVMLKVHRDAYAGAVKPPPVAEFVRDIKEENVIGVQCADGWCILSAEPYSPPSSTNQIDCAGLPDTCKVPGHFDEQDLGYYDWTIWPIIGDMKRRNVVARYVPEPGLESMTDQDYSTPKRVGFVKVLRGSYEKSGITFSESFVSSMALKHVSGTGKNAVYELYVTYAPNTTKKLKVFVVKDHDPEDFPYSAARWSWEPKDEGLWIRCPAGCCKAQL